MDEISSVEIIGGKLKPSPSADLLVPWWSFGKTALAAGILSLVRDGSLSLDELVDGKPYTLRQLLQHTSGLPDYGGLKEYHEAVSHGDPPWPIDELLERANAGHLLFAPGAKFAYSNIGYLFLKRTIEASMNCRLEEALRKLVFEPLSINEVRVANSSEDFQLISAGSGHAYNPNWLYHGFLFSPLASAAFFLDTLMRTDFLPAALKEEMLSSYLIARELPGRPFKNPSYGLGVMEGLSVAGRCVGHTGQGSGSTFAAYHFLDAVPVRMVAAFALGDTVSQGVLEEYIAQLAVK